MAIRKIFTEYWGNYLKNRFVLPFNDDRFSLGESFAGAIVFDEDSLNTR